MDPYDDYMKQQEDWQNEISKRDDEITELKIELRRRWKIIENLAEALQFYANHSNWGMEDSDRDIHSSLCLVDQDGWEVAEKALAKRE